MPFHATVDRVTDGDVVLHWLTDDHPAGPAFIGYSIVDGLPFPVDAVDYEDAKPLPGQHGTHPHGRPILDLGQRRAPYPH